MQGKESWGALPGGQLDIKRYENLPYGKFQEVLAESRYWHWTFEWRAKENADPVIVEVKARSFTVAREMAREQVVHLAPEKKRFRLELVSKVNSVLPVEEEKRAEPDWDYLDGGEDEA